MYSDIRCLDSSMCQTHVTLKKNIKHEHSINVRSFLTINKGLFFYCAVYNPRIQNTVCLVYESFSHAVITTLSLYNHRCTSAKSE